MEFRGAKNTSKQCRLRVDYVYSDLSFEDCLPDALPDCLDLLGKDFQGSCHHFQQIMSASKAKGLCMSASKVVDVWRSILMSFYATLALLKTLGKEYLMIDPWRTELQWTRQLIVCWKAIQIWKWTLTALWKLWKWWKWPVITVTEWWYWYDFGHFYQEIWCWSWTPFNFSVQGFGSPAPFSCNSPVTFRPVATRCLAASWRNNVSWISLLTDFHLCQVWWTNLSTSTSSCAFFFHLSLEAICLRLLAASETAALT